MIYILSLQAIVQSSISCFDSQTIHFSTVIKQGVLSLFLFFLLCGLDDHRNILQIQAHPHFSHFIVRNITVVYTIAISIVWDCVAVY